MSRFVLGYESIIPQGMSARWNCRSLPTLRREVSAGSIVIALQCFERTRPMLDGILAALGIQGEISAFESYRLAPGEILLVPALGQRITFKTGEIRMNPAAPPAAPHRGLNWRIEDLIRQR